MKDYVKASAGALTAMVTMPILGVFGLAMGFAIIIGLDLISER